MAPIAADSITLGPWSGGVNYSLPAEEVAPNGLHDMSNCAIGLAGEVKKRKGYAKFNASTLNSGATITGFGQVTLAGTAKVFAFAGNKFYDVTGGSGTDRTGSETITAGNDYTWDWVLAGSTLVAANGYDNKAIKWTGGSNNISELDVDSRFTKPTYVEFWENRLWAANENSNSDRLWRSDIGDIETWGSLSYYNFGYDLTGLRAFRNTLAVHTEYGIHTLTPSGNSTIPFQVQQQTQRGTIAGRSIVTLPGERQLFIRNDGVYEWSGGPQINKISFALDDRYWPNLNTARLPYAFALYWPKQEEVWFFLPHGSGQTTMNHVIVYSRRMDCWFGPYENFTRDAAAIIDTEPHAGDFAGFIMQHNINDNDDGDAIKAFFETANITPLGSGVEVRWLYANTSFDNLGPYELSVQQTAAGIVGTTENIDMGQSGSLLDSTLRLDESLVAPDVSVLYADTDLSGYDSYSKLRFSNLADDETFTVRRVNLMYKPIGRVRHRKTGLE